MYIFNASSELRGFRYTNGQMFYLEPDSPYVNGDKVNENGDKVPHVFGAEVWLIQAIYGRATDKGQEPDMGIVIGPDEYNNVLEAIGTPDPKFVFQSLEQARAVLIEGKPKKTDLETNVKVGYEIKFSELNKEIEGKVNEITRLKGDIEMFKLNECASNDKILKLETELAQEKTRGEGTEEKLNALRKNYTEKELELKAERDTNQALRQRITSLESELKMTNDTLTASKTNYAKAQEAYNKLNNEFSNVIVNYGMAKQADGLWRIPRTVDEVKNTNALQDLVNRYDLKLFEGKYYLPGDVPSIDKPKSKK